MTDRRVSSLLNGILGRIIARVTGTGFLTFVAPLTADRTATFPDRSLTMRGVSGTQTTGRLSEFDANGDQTNSNIADGITGNVWAPTGALTAARAQNVQDKAGTLALTETSDRHGFKNLLHNGRVLVDQRATLTTPVTIPTAVAAYGPDGWVGIKINATMVATIGKVAVTNTPMVGSLDACRLNVTTLAAVAAADQLCIRRRIEGTIFRRCGFGTAQAASLYVSFWVEATVTGTFSVSLRNGVPDRSYVAGNVTIAAANTRQLVQFTIPGDTSGTWATDTTNAAALDISPVVGSTFQTSAGSWQAGNFLGTSAATLLNNVVGSISVSDLYLGTEPIGTATSDYPHVPYDVELVRCQRYYQSTFPAGVVPAQNAGFSGSFIFAQIGGVSASQLFQECPLPVIMRSAATLTTYNPAAANAQARNLTVGADFSATAVFSTTAAPRAYTLFATSPAASAAGNGCAVHVTLTAEL